MDNQSAVWAPLSRLQPTLLDFNIPLLSSFIYKTHSTYSKEIYFKVYPVIISNSNIGSPVDVSRLINEWKYVVE
jgi:hypothetical protein